MLVIRVLCQNTLFFQLVELVYICGIRTTGKKLEKDYLEPLSKCLGMKHVVATSSIITNSVCLQSWFVKLILNRLDFLKMILVKVDFEV